VIVVILALAPVLLGSALVIVYLAVHHTLRKVLRVLNPAWLWFSGLPMDGVSRTNATWLMRSRGPRPVLHSSGHAVWWHHQPRLLRAGIRTGASLVLLGVLCGLVVDAQATLIAVAVLTVAALGLAGWWLVRWARTWRHNRHYVRPLEGTIVRRIPIRPSSIDVHRSDKGAVKAVDIKWPAETELDTTDQQAVLQAVTDRLAIEAPNAAWKLKGRDRSVRFTPCDRPPPADVSWDDVKAEVMAASGNALVFGVGKKGAIVRATYRESPHIAIPGPSGGGKSNLATVLLLQEMLRGSLIFNLDPKWISHLWLQGLPNVINAHEIPDLHLALAWLGRELHRRTRAAHASANGTGRVRGSVGPRIIVLCEELNYGMPGLKDHWREIRSKEDPKKSPALTGLSDLSCAGRASDMHELLIAQMLTAESTGARDSTIRGNAGIKAMVRPDPPGWNMVVGKHIPMPPQTTAPGRLQLVTGQLVRETQVPYLHLDDKDEAVADKAVAWELAVSGVVAQIPTGPEGVPAALWPAAVSADVLGAFSLPVAGQSVPESPRTDEPAEMISLRQACAEEILQLGDRDPLGAARKAAQRPGFPEIAGWDGPTALYYRTELIEWQDGKVRVLR
jgi:hypothetical protein